MLRYTIDPSHQLVTISGDYSAPGEWEVLFEQILGDRDFRRGFRVLRDLHTVDQPVDAAMMVQVMEVVRAYWPRLTPRRAAMVTPRDFDRAALSAHAIADSYGLPLRMFTDYAAALQWLYE